MKGSRGLLATFFLLLMGDLEIDRLSAEVHCDMGMAFVEQGLLDVAEVEFITALDYVADYSDAVFGLGMVFMMRQSFDDAEELFLTFMEAEPADSRGPLELSRLYLARAEDTEALDMAQWAHDLSPYNPDIWMQIALAAVAAGDTSLAERWLVRTIDGDQSHEPEARVLLAHLHRCHGLESEARELLLPVSTSGYPPALWMLARIYLGWGDNMRAVDNIRMYLTVAPHGEMADSACMILDELAETGDYIPPDTP
jgi:Flp pilus assembly protein TadD